MIYEFVDNIRPFLRSRLRRGSLLWRSASAAQQFIIKSRRLVSGRRWRRNAASFAGAIAAEERAGGEFYFIQVGACDGIIADPIRPLVKARGWRGILVEPQKEAFERLRETYRDEASRLVFENVAIAESEGERTLYKSREPALPEGWQSGLGSLLPSRCDDPSAVETETVQCITFDTLMKRHSLPHVSLLQIDVEGYDYEILKLARLDVLKPHLIRYEHEHLGLHAGAECREFLRALGYRVLPMEYDTGAVLSDAGRIASA